jgi:hypothetical protein
VPGQHHEAVEQAAHEQVDGREDHSGMISPRKTSSATPDRVAEPRALLENEQVTTRIAFPSPTGAVGAGAHPGIPGTATRPTADSKPTPDPKPGTSTIGNRTSEALND